MAKGQEAKSCLIKKVIEALEKDYIGEAGGKYYFWSMEDGQKKQVCISMTCPNTPFESAPGLVDGGYDFSSPATGAAASAFKPAEYTEEEKNNINQLIKQLGL